MIRNRAWRRSQNRTKEHNAFRKFVDNPYNKGESNDDIFAKAKRDARLLANNMKICSCWMCRNEKGDRLFEIAKDLVDSAEIDFEFNNINNKKDA